MPPTTLLTPARPLLALRSLCAPLLLLALGALLGGCKRGAPKVDGVGDVLQAFLIRNCETDERYCQVCAYSGKPTIIAMVDLDDTSAEADLLAIQKLVDAHRDRRLMAFVLFGQFSDGRFSRFEDEESAAKRAREIHGRLGLSYPAAIVPTTLTADEKRRYVPFEESYVVSASRTVLFADAKSEVLHAEVITGDGGEAHRRLEEAVRKAL